MDKIRFFVKWFFAVVPIGIIAIFTSPFIAPIAGLIEFVLPNFNPLWWWLDDEIEDSSRNKDYLSMGFNKNKTLWWLEWHCFRNTMWNLKKQIRPVSARMNCIMNDEIITEVLVDDLRRNGNKVSIYGKCQEVAQWKWIDKFGNEGWDSNKGDKISTKFSTIGELKIWYRAYEHLYFQWTYAKKKRQLGFKKKFPFITKKDYFVSFTIGVKFDRYIFIFKRQLEKS